jgi:hypothetical protein
MRESLIVTALFSIYVSTRGTAKALGAIQKISPYGHRTR